MQPTLQVNLILAGQPCLVIGGNAEAEEKVQRLLEAMAVVRVISPTLTRTLEEWVAQRRIKHTPRDYEPDDEDGQRLVLLCLQGTGYGESLFNACREKGILMGAWDQTKIADLNFPALVRSGPLRVAVSTGGASPGLASAVRKQLERVFDERFGRFAQWVGERRNAISGMPAQVRFDAYRSLTEGFEIKGEVAYPPAWEKTGKP